MIIGKRLDSISVVRSRATSKGLLRTEPSVTSRNIQWRVAFPQLVFLGGLSKYYAVSKGVCRVASQDNLTKRNANQIRILSTKFTKTVIKATVLHPRNVFNLCVVEPMAGCEEGRLLKTRQTKLQTLAIQQ